MCHPRFVYDGYRTAFGRRWMVWGASCSRVILLITWIGLIRFSRSRVIATVSRMMGS
jgi:hypothetical protein